MPQVRYTGGSRYALRDGPTWTEGDVHEVDDATADRLTDTDKFELVAGERDADEDGNQDDDDDETGGYLRDEPPDIQIEEGVCPWCPPDERYEGEAVGQHASRAHPDEWTDYKEAGD